VQQQLPNVTDLQSVTAANVISGAQLAVSYCQTLMTSPTAFFPGISSAQFAQPATTVLGSSPGAGMDLIATPLIQNLTGQGAGGLTLATQPSDSSVRTEIYNLIQALEMENPSATTQNVTMGVCTALLTSATSLIK
jgi:hypothetical protein